MADDFSKGQVEALKVVVAMLLLTQPQHNRSRIIDAITKVLLPEAKRHPPSARYLDGAQEVMTFVVETAQPVSSSELSK